MALAPAVARVPTNSGTSSTVSGTVVGPDGDPLTGGFVWQFDYDTDRPTVTDENGSFAVTGNGTIAFTQRTTDHYWERDGVTDMYAIGQLSENISKITVPVGHVLDASGRPVSGANVSIRDYDADSDASVSTLGETDPNGFYRAHDAPFAGIEVAGNVSVVVQPALTDLRFVQRRYRYAITVTNETTLTIRLDEWRETIDVSSELTGHDDAPASGTVCIRTGRVFTSSDQPDSRLENRSFSLNDSGEFETTVPFDDRMTGSTFHWLTFSQDGLPRDGVSDLFAIE
ncbi:carboxypeptidase-like regulatory domain-containing protein [Haladaptatus sp. NG-WS-4]